MLGLLLPALLVASPALPDAVHVKTLQASFSHENAYALSDGKLWVKPNPLTAGARGEWALFEGKGVPFGKKAKSFGAADRLVAFSTEGLMVVALSDKGRLYLWQPTLFEDTVWQERVGTPLPGPLMLPPSRDWAFSMSLQVAPKKRRTPMHDIVSYYEDTAGNKVEFGFTATVYTLDPDGQRIRYWDTGLPPAFYKAFATPERGRFVAERLSASGSTLAVIDRAGRMFTRMFDYEMNGACPGLRYTFEPRKQGDGILPLFEAERVLPLEGWRAQPPVPLEGQAELTSNVSLHLTGKGNAARELRVQGRDGAGRLGYHFKALFDAAWQFQPTGEAYDPKLVLARGAPPVGRQLAHDYTGTLSQPGAAPLPVELLGFYAFDTPATLRVRAGSTSLELTLHTFDAWGPTVQQADHPDLVGHALGEPKLLVGTLEVPDALLQSEEPETKRIVDTYFRRLHRMHLAFSLAADDVRVDAWTRPVQRTDTRYFNYALRVPLRLELTRTPGPDELALYRETNFTRLAEAPSLEVEGLDALTAADGPRLDAALARNRALLAQIRKSGLERRLTHLGAGAFSATAAALFVPVNAVSDFLDLPARQPLAGGLALTGGALLRDYSRMNLTRVLSSPEDERRAVKRLQARIREYERRRAKLR